MCRIESAHVSKQGRVHSQITTNTHSHSIEIGARPQYEGGKRLNCSREQHIHTRPTHTRAKERQLNSIGKHTSVGSEQHRNTDGQYRGAVCDREERAPRIVVTCCRKSCVCVCVDIVQVRSLESGAVGRVLFRGRDVDGIPRVREADRARRFTLLNTRECRF